MPHSPKGRISALQRLSRSYKVHFSQHLHNVTPTVIISAVTTHQHVSEIPSPKSNATDVERDDYLDADFTNNGKGGELDILVRLGHQEKKKVWSGRWKAKFIREMTSRGGRVLRHEEFFKLLISAAEDRQVTHSGALKRPQPRRRDLTLALLSPSELGLPAQTIVQQNSATAASWVNESKLYLILSWKPRTSVPKSSLGSAPSTVHYPLSLKLRPNSSRTLRPHEVVPRSSPYLRSSQRKPSSSSPSSSSSSSPSLPTVPNTSRTRMVASPSYRSLRDGDQTSLSQIMNPRQQSPRISIHSSRKVHRRTHPSLRPPSSPSSSSSSSDIDFDYQSTKVNKGVYDGSVKLTNKKSDGLMSARSNSSRGRSPSPSYLAPTASSLNRASPRGPKTADFLWREPDTRRTHLPRQSQRQLRLSSGGREPSYRQTFLSQSQDSSYHLKERLQSSLSQAAPISLVDEIQKRLSKLQADLRKVAPSRYSSSSGSSPSPALSRHRQRTSISSSDSQQSHRRRSSRSRRSRSRSLDCTLPVSDALPERLKKSPRVDMWSQLGGQAARGRTQNQSRLSKCQSPPAPPHSNESSRRRSTRSPPEITILSHSNSIGGRSQESWSQKEARRSGRRRRRRAWSTASLPDSSQRYSRQARGRSCHSVSSLSSISDESSSPSSLSVNLGSTSLGLRADTARYGPLHRNLKTKDIRGGGSGCGKYVLRDARRHRPLSEGESIRTHSKPKASSVSGRLQFHRCHRLADHAFGGSVRGVDLCEDLSPCLSAQCHNLFSKNSTQSPNRELQKKARGINQFCHSCNLSSSSSPSSSPSARLLAQQQHHNLSQVQRRASSPFSAYAHNEGHDDSLAIRALPRRTLEPRAGDWLEIGVKDVSQSKAIGSEKLAKSWHEYSRPFHADLAIPPTPLSHLSSVSHATPTFRISSPRRTHSEAQTVNVGPSIISRSLMSQPSRLLYPSTVSTTASKMPTEVASLPFRRSMSPAFPLESEAPPITKPHTPSVAPSRPPTTNNRFLRKIRSPQSTAKVSAGNATSNNRTVLPRGSDTLPAVVKSSLLGKVSEATRLCEAATTSSVPKWSSSSSAMGSDAIECIPKSTNLETITARLEILKSLLHQKRESG